MDMDPRILRSVRAYVEYLIDAGVTEIPRQGRIEPCTPPASRAPGRQDAGQAGKALSEIRADLGECVRCPLAETRHRIVFGEGNPEARILFVGEAPGAEEDRTGRPFVGKAGQLLTDIIERGMGVPRRDVYICNIVKCRPPLNRTPRDEEVSACLPFLEGQIEAIGPEVIVTLGLPAARALLGVEGPMHRIRGQWASYRGIPVMPTYHPAYVLRYYTVGVRRQVWADVLRVMERLKAGKGC